MNNMNKFQLEFATELAKFARIDLERVSFDAPFELDNREWGIICVDKKPAIFFSAPREGDTFSKEKIINFEEDIKDCFYNHLSNKIVYLIQY